MKFLLSLLSLFALAALSCAQRIQPGGSVLFQWARAGRNMFCLASNGYQDGDGVILSSCSGGAANRTWTVPGGSAATGLGPPTQLRIHGSKCLDVRNGVNSNGNKLQIWECAKGNKNQIFNVNDQDQTIRWAGTNKCLDLTNGNTQGSTPIQIWTCNGNNPNQWWAAFTP